MKDGINQGAWEALSPIYEEFLGYIEDSNAQFEKIANPAQIQSQTVGLEMAQQILSMTQNVKVGRAVPCHNLPVAKNPRFLGGKKYSIKLMNTYFPLQQTMGFLHWHYEVWVG